MHDHSPDFLCLFSDWLYHLSCAHWREILRIHRLDRGDLLSNPYFTRSAGFCDAAAGHHDACSSFSSPVGPAQTDRALDDPNLALRVCYGSSRLFDALPMVPPAGALTAVALGPQRITRLRARRHAPSGKGVQRQNLALDDDLMFDQCEVPPRIKETLW